MIRSSGSGEARDAVYFDYDVMGMTFAPGERLMRVSSGRNERPTRDHIIAGIHEARRHLENSLAGRKFICCDRRRNRGEPRQSRKALG